MIFNKLNYFYLIKLSLSLKIREKYYNILFKSIKNFFYSKFSYYLLLLLDDTS